MSYFTANLRRDMDKFWSILTMPFGVFACFTPVLIAWVLTERRKSADNKNKERR